MITVSHATGWEGFFDHVPAEITKRILQHVGDPAVVAKVCRQWRAIVSEPSFYATYLEKIEWCCGSSEAFQRLKDAAWVFKTDNLKGQMKKIFHYLCLLRLSEADTNPYYSPEPEYFSFSSPIDPKYVIPSGPPFSLEKLNWAISLAKFSENQALVVAFLNILVRVEEILVNKEELVQKFSSFKELKNCCEMTQHNFDENTIQDSARFIKMAFPQEQLLELASAIRQDLVERRQEFSAIFREVKTLRVREIKVIRGNSVIPPEIADIAQNVTRLSCSGSWTEGRRVSLQFLGKIKNLEYLSFCRVPEEPDFVDWAFQSFDKNLLPTEAWQEWKKKKEEGFNGDISYLQDNVLEQMPNLKVVKIWPTSCCKTAYRLRKRGLKVIGHNNMPYPSAITTLLGGPIAPLSKAALTALCIGVVIPIAIPFYLTIVINKYGTHQLRAAARRNSKLLQVAMLCALLYTCLMVFTRTEES